MSEAILDGLLDEAEDVMFRHVHPSFDKASGLDPQAFRPTRADMGYLSVDRSTLTTPKQSFDLQKSKGLKTSKVVGVSVQEFNEAELSVYANPISDHESEPDNLAHALVDCTGLPPGKGKLDKGRRMSVYLQLVSYAEDRGPLYSE